MIRKLILLLFPVLLSAYSPEKMEWRQVLDKAVVINLNRHIHRYEETKFFMEKAGFTNIRRFEGVDGFFTEKSFFESLNVWTGGPGQKGCAASHLLVWEDFLAHSDKDYLFVAEDDMLPHSHFADLFPLYWDKTPESFDIVMVGNQMDYHSPSRRERFVVSVPSFCTHAYIISKKGARKLLDLYRSLSREETNVHVIDIFMIKMMLGGKIDYYCYNGQIFKDLENDSIFVGRDTGICFQNKELGSTIHQKDIIFEQE